MKLRIISAILACLVSLNAFAYIASPGVKVDNIKIHCTHPDRCGFISRDDLTKKRIEKFDFKKKDGN